MNPKKIAEEFIKQYKNGKMEWNQNKIDDVTSTKHSVNYVAPIDQYETERLIKYIKKETKKINGSHVILSGIHYQMTNNCIMGIGESTAENDYDIPFYQEFRLLYTISK